MYMLYRPQESDLDDNFCHMHPVGRSSQHDYVLPRNTLYEGTGKDLECTNADLLARNDIKFQASAEEPSNYSVISGHFVALDRNILDQ